MTEQLVRAQTNEGEMVMLENVGALILAAGKGTRMHSDRPKVLQEILGEPMLWYVYAALEPLFGQRVHTVVGHGAGEVEAAFPGAAQRFVLQEEQLGTGHALQVALDVLYKAGYERVLVINGDTPLITPAHLQSLVHEAERTDADVAFTSITPVDPGAFGRVIRDVDGNVVAIVEAKDFDPETHGRDCDEVNAGIYCLRLSRLASMLSRLRNDNKSGEYYITDLVSLAREEELRVHAVCCGDAPDLMGINSPLELVSAEERLAASIIANLLGRGVLVRAPGSVRIGPRACIDPGAEIIGPCEILGHSRIHRGVRVAAQVFVRDCMLDEKCRIHEFSHLEGAEVGPGCNVGPFARLRPGTVLKEGAKVGNFVEMKKALLGPGAKASHLSYLGDAEVGAEANIGAGTITCNYDGRNKHRTVIGARAFIGSNTALVAPIEIGEEALVGAGSTLTKNVPPRSLAIARARQREIPRKR